MWITINEIPVNTSNMEPPFLKEEADGTCWLLLFGNDRDIIRAKYPSKKEAQSSMEFLLWNINKVERLPFPVKGILLHNITCKGK